jgi:hypothetical protein
MDGGNIMVLKYITKGGTRIHGPPYTKAEEAEFYRRQGRGPVTVVRPLMTVKSRSPEHRGSRRRQSQRVPGSRRSGIHANGIGTRPAVEISFRIFALSYRWRQINEDRRRVGNTRFSITEPMCKQICAVPDWTTLFRVHLREPEAHAHPAVHIFCSGEMLAGALRIARAAMKPTQAEMTMSDDRPHPARLAERQSFRVMSGGAFGIEAIGLDG